MRRAKVAHWLSGRCSVVLALMVGIVTEMVSLMIHARFANVFCGLVDQICDGIVPLVYEAPNPTIFRLRCCCCGRCRVVGDHDCPRLLSASSPVVEVLPRLLPLRRHPLELLAVRHSLIVVASKDGASLPHRPGEKKGAIGVALGIWCFCLVFMKTCVPHGRNVVFPWSWDPITGNMVLSSWGVVRLNGFVYIVVVSTRSLWMNRQGRWYGL